MRPIAIFYHGLFYRDSEWLQPAFDISREQFYEADESGLLAQANEIHIGLNGGPESLEPARFVFPGRSRIVLHGLDSKNENSTIVMLEEWLKAHPGQHWNVLYFHCKGGTHKVGDEITSAWRNCMMRHTVRRWRTCVDDLEKKPLDAVGCHWMEPPETPEGQYIFAGTFFWSTSDFLSSLPSILDRPQIKNTGLKHVDSRYEAEVWLGNGPRKPRVRDYHGPRWNPGMWSTCKKP